MGTMRIWSQYSAPSEPIPPKGPAESSSFGNCGHCKGKGADRVQRFRVQRFRVQRFRVLWPFFHSLTARSYSDVALDPLSPGPQEHSGVSNQFEGLPGRVVDVSP